MSMSMRMSRSMGMRKSSWTAMNGDILHNGATCNIEYMAEGSDKVIKSTALCIIEYRNHPVFLEKEQNKIFRFQDVRVLGIHEPDNYEEGEYFVTFPDGREENANLKFSSIRGSWILTLKPLKIETPIILEFPEECNGCTLRRVEQEYKSEELGSSVIKIL